MKKIYTLLLLVVLLISCGCGGSNKKNGNAKEAASSGDNTVVIYSSAEDYRNDYLLKKLKEKFPNYNIKLEYLSTGKHAARLKSEGEKTACDISFDLEKDYAMQLKNLYADLSAYDTSIYMDDLVSKDKIWLPECRLGGAIIINKDVIKEKGLTVPRSYQDLLKPEYKGLISMPNPKSSGTGYIFLKSLVNAWGEEKALQYFDKLSDNILQYTSSGSGPVNALVNKEVAIGLGMTAQAALKKTEGANLEILYFSEGSPYTYYVATMIKGKEKKKAVKDVFDYFYSTLIEDDVRLFFPEKLYKNKDFTLKNMPKDIKYADMKNDTIEEKMRLLGKWNH